MSLIKVGVQQEVAELPHQQLSHFYLASGSKVKLPAGPQSAPKLRQNSQCHLPAPATQQPDSCFPGPSQPPKRGPEERLSQLGLYPGCPGPGARRRGPEGWKPASPAGSQRPRLALHGAPSPPPPVSQRAARPTLASRPAWAPKRAQSGDQPKGARGTGTGGGFQPHPALLGPGFPYCPLQVPKRQAQPIISSPPPSLNLLITPILQTKARKRRRVK